MIYFHSLFDDCPVRRAVVFCAIGNFVPIAQKRSAGMRTAAYNVEVASIVVHLQSKCTARSIAEEQNQAYAKFDMKYIIRSYGTFLLRKV